MNRIAVIAFLLLLCCSEIPCPAQQPAPVIVAQPADNHIRKAEYLPNHGKSEGTLDGDTAWFIIRLCDHPEISITRKIRLHGIHMPEIGRNGKPSEPGAENARHVLEDILSKAKVIAIRLYAHETDDRIEGTVYADGKSVNDQMAKLPPGGR